MANRRPIQIRHERAVIQNFLTWINSRRGTRFKIIEEPNPPDAIIKSVHSTRWVEVTDAFFSNSYARDLYSYATPGEEHKPIEPGPYYYPDASFVFRFVDVLSSKLKKQSYLPYLEKYGAGFLIVPIQYPLFDGQTINIMKKRWLSMQPVENLGCFKEVYITFSSLNRPTFLRWKT